MKRNQKELNLRHILSGTLNCTSNLRCDVIGIHQHHHQQQSLRHFRMSMTIERCVKPIRVQIRSLSSFKH